MTHDFFAHVAKLRQDGRPFAVATVVARRAPVSAHLGDRAIVFADGRMEGFVGGACSREIVRRQALDALAGRSARLVSIRPDTGEAHDQSADRVVVPMTCASEGAVDVYIEPIVRPRTIVVAGATPVADAIARLALAMRYDVVRVVDDRERQDIEESVAATGAQVRPFDSLAGVLDEATANGGDCAAIVASQGHYDEPAVEAMLRSDAPYVGLVASRKRGATVREWLTENHVRGIDRLRSPAGLDLGGRSAEEVAVSILGEIVQAGAAAATVATSHPASIAAGAGPEVPPVVAIDPVCHMEVEVEGARHTADVDGTTYYFCCGGCRARFVKDPQRYLAATP
jgi:xanthine dehydrogenase accessory factor